jgi:putative mRNA 3-end processing factor
VFVTHGSIAILVRWLTEQGLDAQGFRTEYGDEDGDGEDSAAGGAGSADAPAGEAAR